VARSNFSFDKRRKELEKMKKKEAKRQAKAERKAAVEAGEVVPEPVVVIDEYGNAVEVLPEADPDAAEAEDRDNLPD
jgi:S-adenosylmethionine hydrolase